MRIAAVVVTFNPTGEHVSNIEELGRQFEKVIIVDNSTVNGNHSSHFSDNSLFEVINLGGNFGIGRALNEGMSKASFEYDFCVTFDQDSRPEADFLSRMKKKLKKLDSRTALLAPNFFDRNSKTYATFTLFQNGSFKILMQCQMLKNC